MQIEIDQSGKKIETTNVETILAFSNSVDRALIIPAKVKKQCIRELRRESWKEQIFIDQIFSAGIYLLIKGHLKKIEKIIIDVEYPGREANIKGMLLDLIRKDIPEFSKKDIHFRQITKYSPAHHKAYSAYQGLQTPDQILTAEEILKTLGK